MILNLSAGDNTSKEVVVLLTEFMNEVNNTLTSFKSEINTMLTGFTNDVDSDITGLSNNLTTVKTDVATLSTTVSALPKGAIKSVQRGTVTSKVDNNNIVISINPINPNKSFVLIDIGGAPETTHQLPILLSLTETQVTFSPSYMNGNPTTHIKFSWQVIEFY